MCQASRAALLLIYTLLILTWALLQRVLPLLLLVMQQSTRCTNLLASHNEQFLEASPVIAPVLQMRIK